MFPAETLEKILSFCDGKTLYNARHVSESWKQCVDYLTEKTSIWRRCCHEDIPESQLIEYLERFSTLNVDNKYMHIYDNWTIWQNVKENIDFSIVLSPVVIPRITCLAISGHYTAVGSEDGRVRIYNERWDCLYADRFLGTKVLDITFIDDDTRTITELTKPFLIVFYKSGTLYINDYEDRAQEPLVIHDVKLYSVYKRYICLVKIGGRISVVKLITDEETGLKRFLEITYVRIYSPNEVTEVTIWKGVCTFLMNSEVKILKYEHDIQPMTIVENKTRLKFCTKSSHNMLRTCQIYRNDIVISLTSDTLNDQLLELFILGPRECVSKKLFNTWEVLQSNITCMFLYGNTFILGVDIGSIYVYAVDSWKTFDIRKYQEVIIIGKHPIISIDVKESIGERKFFVASSFNIHEVVGFSIINLRP